MRLGRSYKDAINALNSLQSNFAAVQAARFLDVLPQQRSMLSLNEVLEYSRRLGYAPDDFNRLNVIHIAGTKGKGSTCAFTESILSRYRGQDSISKIGLFTSPHLVSVRERIRIDGEPISKSKFAHYFFEVWDRLSSTTSDAGQCPTLQPSAEVKPMYFKYLTLLSFHVFMCENVDTAIYEVGVGGRYDCTNIVRRPSVAAVTSLGIDHTFMLGDTIESIAWNKAGIFKRGCSAVVCEQPDYPQSMDIVEREARATGVSSFEVVHASAVPAHVRLGLAGDFQHRNAAVAVAIARTHLRQLGIDFGLLNAGTDTITDGDASFALPDAFVRGLACARWDGRCQTIRNSPGYDRVTWYIDGAHTVESIRGACAWFRGAVTRCDVPRVLLFNQQNRDNTTQLLQHLYEGVRETPQVAFDHVVFTTNVTWGDGSSNPDFVSMNVSKDVVDKMVVQKKLAEWWAALDVQHGLSAHKHIFPNIEKSLRFIHSLTNDKWDVEVFVCGSLHLVGGVLAVLKGIRD
ncbi:FolC bifunctional protein [Metschnikowia bicuspidata]|uniref:Folylpolyglutamate synthase n=1 Tax=Metschnikowia bicuspidata TaxID=27322 RepID=A0A4P9ZD46_9ASCO|nr:FolC bifunctional protein [Metschnikowia bicuspidata]